MAFNQSQFAPVSAQASDTPALYLYKTTDSLSTVLASDYFAAKKYQLSVGDIIFSYINGLFKPIEILAISPAVTSKESFSTLDENGWLGIGTTSPHCNIHVLDDSGLVCVRIESTDPTGGVMQLQLINDISKELSIGKLGSSVDYFGTGSGAVLNREGNLNVVNDSNDPIIFYTDATDSQNLTATEKLRIEPGGMVVYSEGGQGWKDENIGAASLGGPVGLRPGIVEFVDTNGAATGIYSLGVGVTEKLSGTFEMQHDYKEASDFSFHFHFQGDTVPTGTDKIKFQLDYTITDNGIPLAAVTTLVKEVDYDTAYAFNVIGFDTIDGTSVSIGDQFLFSLTRIAASVDEYAGEVVLATVGIHYQVDTIGSRQVFVK